MRVHQMRIRPWPLTFLAVLHWFSPVGNVVVNSWHTHTPIADYWQALILPQARVHLFVLLVVPILMGTCIFLCRKWSYWTFIGLMGLSLVYSIITSTNHFTWDRIFFICSLYVVNLIVTTYVMAPGIRTIYFNPKIRWWQTDPRYFAEFPVTVQVDANTLANGTVRNISIGGFFIETPAALTVNQSYNLEFNYSGEKVNLQAVPVFQKPSVPPGYGFRVSSREARKNHLRQIVNQLRKSGAIIPGNQPRPEDSFRFWWKRALKNKQAWLPDPGGR